MDDQHSTNAETGGHLDSLSPTASGGKKVAHAEGYGAASSNETGASKNHGDRSPHSRRVTIARRLATGTAIAAIAGLVVNFFTLLAIRGQLDEMRSSSLQVERAIQQSTRLADASASSADTAKQALVAQQRGWMSIMAYSPASPALNTDFPITVTFNDVGQSPSLHVSTFYEARISDISIVDLNEFLNGSMQDGQLSVFPGNGIQDTASVLGTSIDQATLDALNSGKKILIVLAKVSYSDLSGNKHSTGSCFRYDMKAHNFPYCPAGNWAN